MAQVSNMEKRYDQPCIMDATGQDVSHSHSLDGRRPHRQWQGQGNYHVLVESNGKLVRGVRPIDANAKGSRKKPASHTLNANTGAIGVSMCCMGGRDVKENPFVAGPFPMSRVQWDKMVDVVAALSKRYGVPVTSKTILTHAEVEPNLGIKSRRKWDITRLPSDPSVVGAKAVGDKLRREVAFTLDKATLEPANGISDDLVPRKFRVIGVEPSTLNFRDGPNGPKKGALSEDMVVEKLNEDNGWWQVRTLAGFVGWVWGEFLEPI
jgi:hypothetical protein